MKVDIGGFVDWELRRALPRRTIFNAITSEPILYAVDSAADGKTTPDVEGMSIRLPKQP